MASNYNIDELDRITATLEHLQDAMQVYFDRQKEWTGVDMQTLSRALVDAQRQLVQLSDDHSTRPIAFTRSAGVH